MEPTTFKSYDFLKNPYDSSAAAHLDRGEGFLDAIVAVVDGCRKTEIACNREELIFLHPNGLDKYEVHPKYCQQCAEHQTGDIGGVSISAHGFFCASIIASKRLDDALMGSMNLGTLRGISPPPRISLYGVGCPTCPKLTVEDIVWGLGAARKAKVNVISLSCAQTNPAWLMLMSPEKYGDYFYIDVETLKAFSNGILTVVTAGNKGGDYYLGSIAKFPPWTLTVGSCSKTSWFKGKVEFQTNVLLDEYVEGKSVRVFPMSDFAQLRKIGDIEGKLCKIYQDGGQMVIEVCNREDSSNDINIPIYVSKKDATKISELMKLALKDNDGNISVKISSSDMELPQVSNFSGRGPCGEYCDFMKPDLCAPGDDIAASWPPDVLLSDRSDVDHRDHRDVDYAEFNVLRGSSFAVAHVAAAVARVIATKGFSASAAFSAAITTATKMHGMDPIGREYAYGAGMLNIERIVKPGAVHEEHADNYKKWKNGKLPHFLLNLPYYSARIPISPEPWRCTFQRRLRSTESGPCTFHGFIVVHRTNLQLDEKELLEGIKVIPDTLYFEHEAEVLDFSVDVRLSNTRLRDKVSVGFISASLRWEKKGEEDVTIDSPIILAADKLPERHIVADLYRKTKKSS